MLSVMKMIREQLTGVRGFILLVVSAVLLVLPVVFWYADLPFPANTLFLCLMYAILAMGWNILAGYGGQLSFGHAIFFGIGAYVTMILMLYFGITPWIGIFVGGFIAAVTGLGLGVPLFRLRSHWFTLATIAALEIFRLVFISWKWVGGAAGLQPPIVPPELSLYYLQYAGPFIYIYIALGILALEVIVLHMIVNSKIGFYLQAIREDEYAAMSVGISPFKYKMIAMFISAFFCGIGGGLYTIRFRFIDPFAVFDLITISVYMVVAGILGGMHTFVGPIVGSFIFIPITEYVRAQIVARFPRYYGLHVFILGIILAIITIAMPEGVMGWLEEKGIVSRKIGIASFESLHKGDESHESASP
ncbi:MAG: branched-chain amino acid ABC transporter permease [Candidatus Methanomethylicota archaeon]|uniref:Branched-chain amino acid ABC transporter permease n=1 Tax=Thermoproteota archaeon TaxID=2056631 RepID=A0A497F8W6_9CREN|nr:MAG: branched-chain amino acid ABC transporter permease [Candidatus Verstraetearchaeota archaeon]